MGAGDVGRGLPGTGVDGGFGTSRVTVLRAGPGPGNSDSDSDT